MHKGVHNTQRDNYSQKILQTYREKANHIIRQMMQVLTRAHKKVDEAEYRERIKSLKENK